MKAHFSISSRADRPAVRGGSRTPAADVIPALGKIGYASGLAASNVSTAAIGILINPVFNITLGLSPAILSAMVFLQRLWNVTLDPIAGHMSDNLRWR